MKEKRGNQATLSLNDDTITKTKNMIGYYNLRTDDYFKTCMSSLTNDHSPLE